MFCRVTSPLFAIGLLLGAVASAWAQCEAGEAGIGRSGIWNNVEQRINAEEFPFQEGFTQSWRVRFEVRGAQNCEGRILIRDRTWRLVQAYDLRNGSGWSRHIPGETIFVSLEGCSDSGVTVVNQYTSNAS